MNGGRQECFFSIFSIEEEEEMGKGGPGRYRLDFGEENKVGSEVEGSVVRERWLVPGDRPRYVIRSVSWWKEYQYRCNRSLVVVLESCGFVS